MRFLLTKAKLLLIILNITGCGQDLPPEPTKEVIYEPGPVIQVPGPTQVVTVESPPKVEPPTKLEDLVQDYNDWRFAQGLSPITPGLNCSLYNLSPVPAPAGPPSWYQPSVFPAALPSAAASFSYIGEFNQEPIGSAQGINILPHALQTQYTQWYAIRCTGNIVVVESKYYSYELTSDDASLLYIDNVKVVDNDGNHGTQLRSGTRLLQKGVHTFRLDYMSGPGGGQSLILTSEGILVPEESFWR